MSDRVTLADCPYRAGTEEANHWIKTVYIRSEEAHGRYREDRAKYVKMPATTAGYSGPVQLVHDPVTGRLSRPLLSEENLMLARREILARMERDEQPQTVEEIIAELLA